MELCCPLSPFAPEGLDGFAGTQELRMVLVILTHVFEANLAPITGYVVHVEC